MLLSGLQEKNHFNCNFDESEIATFPNKNLLQRVKDFLDRQNNAKMISEVILAKV